MMHPMYEYVAGPAVLPRSTRPNKLISPGQRLHLTPDGNNTGRFIFAGGTIRITLGLVTSDHILVICFQPMFSDLRQSCCMVHHLQILP